MVAIALVGGFGLGAVCAVALLYCLKGPAVALGLREKGANAQAPAMAEAAGGEAEMSFEKQLRNMLEYDGKPKKQEQVNENAD